MADEGSNGPGCPRQLAPASITSLLEAMDTARALEGACGALMGQLLQSGKRVPAEFFSNLARGWLAGRASWMVASSSLLINESDGLEEWGNATRIMGLVGGEALPDSVMRKAKRALQQASGAQGSMQSRVPPGFGRPPKTLPKRLGAKPAKLGH